MRAIIEVDVPDYQIGQEVSIYFKDTMMIKGIVQESSETIHGSTYGGVSWGGTYKPQEPSGDLMSRQVIKDKYKERLVNSLKDDDRGIDLSEYAEEPYKAFCKFMDSIPPVNPQKSCDTCEHSDETDGSHCYECVKGMKDNYDSQEPKTDF